MKWLLLVGLVGIGLWYGLRLVSLPSGEIRPTPLPSPQATGIFGLAEQESELRRIEGDFGRYRYGIYTVAAAEAVRVGINVDLASSSAGLADKSSCTGLTSAAFYDTNNQPLGMLVSGGKTLVEFHTNVLLNGVLGYDRDASEAVLVYEPGTRNFIWAVQAGPVLVMDQTPMRLQLKSDQQARRIVAGLTNDRELVVMVLVAHDSLFSGPLLVDLPALVMAVAARENLIITQALNLDGGTASAFLTPTLKLKELKPIGSYLCLP